MIAIRTHLKWLRLYLIWTEPNRANRPWTEPAEPPEPDEPEPPEPDKDSEPDEPEPREPETQPNRLEPNRTESSLIIVLYKWTAGQTYPSRCDVKLYVSSCAWRDMYL